MAPPGGRPRPPHIRLNSAQDDLLGLVDAENNNPFANPTNRQPASRSLMQQNSRPSTRNGGASSGPLLSPTTPTTPLTPTDPSRERLLPPSSRSHAPRYRDDPSSNFSSRRNSLDTASVSSRDSRYGPFADTATNSRAPSRADSEDDGLNTQTVSEKYNILPNSGLLLFPEDVEKDDWLHNPDPNEDLRDTRCREMLSWRGLVNVGGLAFIILGTLMLFIGYPLLTFVRHEIDPDSAATCAKNPMCISDTLPLLKNVRTGLIDPTTPSNVKTRTGAKGQTQNLVFSDEFNTPGRTFYDGDDPFFQGVDIWYGVTQDLEWYDPDAITTGNGTLTLQFDAFPNHGLQYRSGMLQSWNKLCFKGGYIEASISLPGNGQTVGFWPGFWTMGNLGRPGYAASTDGMWPYSYDNVCDSGITPNQSDPSGINYLPGMRLPACTCTGQDHPSPGTSRSAPEIDALEGTVSPLGPNADVGVASQSVQIAPFDIWYRPNFEWMEVYDYAITAMNSYEGGPYQQAVSAISFLNNDWYNGNAYQNYGFEYKPGTAADGAYVTFYAGEPTWSLDANSLGPNGNIAARTIAEEPMSIIANLGMSDGFSAVNISGITELLPATMRFDYIRIYQDEGSELVTCDPEGYETTQYIAQHSEAYQNPNITKWHQTGFSWPQNTLMDGCTANSNFQF